MDWITNPEIWISLLTLTAIEIVLGIDNIVFIAVLAGRLPKSKQALARNVGLAVAMVMRILLLLSIAWVMGLTQPLFTLIDLEFSGRDLILFGGGLFLLGKSTVEIHHALEGHEGDEGKMAATFGGVIVQIMLLDLVFSLDSVITAVGLAEHVPVMIAAIVIAVGVMMVSAGAISGFIEEHPTLKILALSFLLLIGMSLVAESFALHIPKGYMYFAMAFSVFVEILNLRLRRGTPVKLKERVPRRKQAGDEVIEAAK